MQTVREGGHVGIAGDDTVVVLDIDDIAVREIPTGVHNGPARGGPDRGPVRRHHVHARMAPGEAARDIFEFGCRHTHPSAQRLRMRGQRRQCQQYPDEEPH